MEGEDENGLALGATSVGSLDPEVKKRDRVLRRPFMLMTTKPCLLVFLFGFYFFRIRVLLLFTLHCANVFIFSAMGSKHEKPQRRWVVWEMMVCPGSFRML